MSNEKKQEKKEQVQGRTPGRKLTRDDLAKTMGGALMRGCCTQGCCGDEPEIFS